MRSTVLSTSLSVMLAMAGSARAMDFDTVQVEPGTYAIGGNGEIHPGDDRTLHAIVGNLPSGAKIAVVVLTSPGGNLTEGTRLARTIRNSHVSTLVTGVCASACFLLWAAGTVKAVQYGSRIGVHSASYLGGETPTSQAVTTQMARLAHEFEVPDAIIGRMVTTPPDAMAWLSAGDLRTMPGIQFLEASSAGAGGYEPGSALQTGQSPSRPSPPLEATLTPPSSSATPQPSQSFLLGRQARGDWEQWFGIVSGDLHEGAEWWAGIRSRAAREKLSCESQGGMTAAWLAGCQQARAKLAPVDRARLTDADFKSGWNSL